MASHVFVYGTLKTGEPNHYWFEDQSHGFAEIVGPAETAEKFPLVIATKYNLPMLLGMLLQSKHPFDDLFRSIWNWTKHQRRSV
jgi:hypothetical protein